MAVDYTNLANVALRLIGENGRSVTLTKKSRTLVDAAKPWRGTNDTLNTTLVATAVLFDVTDEQISLNIAGGEDNRDLILRGDKMAVVAANSTSGQNLRSFDTFLDESEVYQIINVETVKPGPTTILYILQLRV